MKKKILYTEIIPESQPSELLTGKLILVIGAGSGIGRSVAVNAEKAGAHVILAGRNGKNLEEVQKSMNQADIEVFDITSEESASSVFMHCMKKYEKLPDVVINSAGARVESDRQISPEMVTAEEWDEVFQTNFYGNIRLVQNYDIALNKASYTGKYLAVSSIDGMRPAATAYGLSKGCLNSFIDSTPDFLNSCRAYAIAPGPTATKMMNENMKFQYYRKDHPDLRCAVPQDIANLAVFMASDRYSGNVGSVVRCDGGFIL